MLLTIIIGKSSNLSNNLYQKITNCFLVSSRDILSSVDVLSEFKDRNINIIFNNFQPATELNNIQNSSQYIKNSILGTSIVLDYFKDTNINKIIYTSSSSVYGNNILCKEDDELKPMNLHASLKVANEKLIERYCNENSINYTIARIFNMYGGDDKFSIVSKIIDVCLNHKELTIVNNGNAIRDFIHIDDVISIYLNILDFSDVKVLNIGTGYGSSIKKILDFLSNNGINIETKNIYRDELKTSTSDTRLLFKVIKKKPFFKIEEYLRKELNL